VSKTWADACPLVKQPRKQINITGGGPKLLGLERIKDR
jgi:hypothetical protein